MDLVKITQLTRQFGISSRTLRYYEQMGLIKSVRPPFETYRYYDEATIERLGEIAILRKMQISIRDIVRVYREPELSTLVEVSAEKITAIDREVTTLSELKDLVDAFLRKMLEGASATFPLCHCCMKRR